MKNIRPFKTKEDFEIFCKEEPILGNILKRTPFQILRNEFRKMVKKLKNGKMKNDREI